MPSDCPSPLLLYNELRRHLCICQLSIGTEVPIVLSLGTKAEGLAIKSPVKIYEYKQKCYGLVFFYETSASSCNVLWRDAGIFNKFQLVVVQEKLSPVGWKISGFSLGERGEEGELFWFFLSCALYIKLKYMFHPFSSPNNKSCIQLQQLCSMHFNDWFVNILEL